jgi:tetratricopeptide (TPR) repeat protein
MRRSEFEVERFACYNVLSEIDRKKGSQVEFKDLIQRISINLGEELLPARMAGILYETGLNYYNSAQYRIALHYYLAALPLYDNLKNAEDKAKLLNMIGNCYYVIMQYTEAKHYYLKALKLSENNVNYLVNLGALYLIINKKSAAESCFRQAKMTALSSGNEHHKTLIHYHLGNYYYLMNDPEKADEYYSYAQKKTGQSDKIISLFSRMQQGELSYRRGNFEEASLILQECEKKCDNNGDLELLSIVYLLLTKSHEASNHYRTALSYLEKYLQILDKLNNYWSLNCDSREKENIVSDQIILESHILDYIVHKYSNSLCIMNLMNDFIQPFSTIKSLTDQIIISEERFPGSLPENILNSAISLSQAEHQLESIFHKIIDLWDFNPCDDLKYNDKTPAELINEVIGIFKPQYNKQGIMINFHISEHQPHLHLNTFDLKDALICSLYCGKIFLNFTSMSYNTIDISLVSLDDNLEIILDCHGDKKSTTDFNCIIKHGLDELPEDFHKSYSIAKWILSKQNGNISITYETDTRLVMKILLKMWS